MFKLIRVVLSAVIMMASSFAVASDSDGTTAYNYIFDNSFSGWTAMYMNNFPGTALTATPYSMSISSGNSSLSFSLTDFNGRKASCSLSKLDVFVYGSSSIPAAPSFDQIISTWNNYLALPSTTRNAFTVYFNKSGQCTQANSAGGQVSL